MINLKEIVVKTLLVLCLLLITGCTDSMSGRVGAWGERHKLTLYSGGVKVGEWTSTGVPETDASGEGWAFVDVATGRLMRISGDMVVETLADAR